MFTQADKFHTVSTCGQNIQLKLPTDVIIIIVTIIIISQTLIRL